MRAAALFMTAIFFCAALLCGGCQKKTEKARPERVVNVKVWTIAKQTVQPFVEAVGTLKPYDEASISPEVDGILSSVKVDEGSVVTKGMALAVIKDTDYRLALDQALSARKQAEALLANVKAEYQRKEALLKEDLVTRQQFDDVATRLSIATQDLDKATAALALARERLDKTVVRSPLDGVVRQRIATSGDFVRASVPILSIIQNDPLKLSFAIAEKDLGSVKVGQKVVFTVDAFPGSEFEGRLSVLYPSLDERSRTLTVEALVPNDTLTLKPGLFARVKVFTSAPKETVVVPITSLLYEGTRIRAFVLEGNKASERTVAVGGKYGDMVDIREGLKAGEQLVVVGQNQLMDGVTVRVVR
ncbi:MAG TPA: efflux RND transporter periplasmic adaptor subunit [Deltaproteobacteria bacterium]|nr:efflux RND transporter periplasmic adaptor subunit [Deltaproteobacteria bacterium]